MKKFTNYLGLPAKVNFVKNVVVSNQRPNSEIEFKNIEDKKKSTIFLMKKEFAALAGLQK